MPRPQKNGIDYFPLDVNFFSDPKIKILKARYGVDGIAIYIYLLCEIYRAGYYIRFDEDRLFILSDDLSMSSDKVMQVLTFLLDRSMLDSMLFQSDAVLTSAGIQRRFQLAVKERAKKTPIEIKGFWLLEEAETEPFIKVNRFWNKSRKKEDISGKNRCKSPKLSLKERKEKERKEEERKGYRENAAGQDRAPDYPYREVIAYLNLRAGTEYRDSTAETRKLIKARCSEGYTLSDFKVVIDKKVEEWGREPEAGEKDMRQYLRPTTLFGNKFEAYFNQKPIKHLNKNQFQYAQQRDTDYDAWIHQELQKAQEPGGERGAQDGKMV